MLNLKSAAQQSRKRVSKRLTNVDKKSKIPRGVVFIQSKTNFATHLLEELAKSGDQRQGPCPAPASLFLAFPEKLFAKWSYLSYGPLRKGHSKDKKIQASEFVEWKLWDQLGAETKLSNYPNRSLKAVLVAHGLSPIPDTCLLLADLGQASRAAFALDIPLHVLVADVSWMSYNRSIRALGLKDQEIEKGLRLCLDSRQRLYKALDIKYKIHSILPYEKKGAIHEKKIRLIAQHYTQLATLLWGRDIVMSKDPMSLELINRINKPLRISIEKESPLIHLNKFSDAIDSLEKALLPHLDILRTLAKRFRLIGEETLSYYFAQYYAQKEYRGSYLKVCVSSERNFDEPFDDLEDSFSYWGDGHTLEPPIKKQRKKKNRLAAMYLPQYNMGKRKILPYSTLSLDAMDCSGDIKSLLNECILISDDAKQYSKIQNILQETLKVNVLQLNRLCANILSFVIWVVKRRGVELLNEICKSNNWKLNNILDSIQNGLFSWFVMETEESSTPAQLWETWLNQVEYSDNPDYMPPHLVISIMTIDDWDNDTLDAVTKFFIVVNLLASRLIAL